MISKDWTILSIVFPLYSWYRSQDAVIENLILSEADWGILVMKERERTSRAISQGQPSDVMRGLEPDKNDSQQSIRSITLYVTVASRPQKITQPGIQCDIKLKYIKPTNPFFKKDESTFIH